MSNPVITHDCVICGRPVGSVYQWNGKDAWHPNCRDLNQDRADALARENARLRTALQQLQRMTDGVTDIGWHALNEARVIIGCALSPDAPASEDGPKYQRCPKYFRLAMGFERALCQLDEGHAGECGCWPPSAVEPAHKKECGCSDEHECEHDWGAPSAVEPGKDK